MFAKVTETARFAGFILLAVSLSFAGTSATETQTTSSATKPKATPHAVHHRRTRKARVRGQKAIDGERVREIQQALIREHYLKGEPSGKWDATTQEAIRHYQADQGWQTKTIPDSRALIRLGLGPDNGHLLNPESAMTTGPAAKASASTTTKASDDQSSASTNSPAPENATQVSTPASSMPADPPQ